MYKKKPPISITEAEEKRRYRNRPDEPKQGPLTYNGATPQKVEPQQEVKQSLLKRLARPFNSPRFLALIVLILAVGFVIQYAVPRHQFLPIATGQQRIGERLDALDKIKNSQTTRVDNIIESITKLEARLATLERWSQSIEKK